MAAIKQKNNKKSVLETYHVLGEWSSLTREQLIELIDSSCTQVPADCRDTIVFSIRQEQTDPYSDSQIAYLAMQWKRLETNNEYTARIEREDKARLERERYEREEFERLSKKFAESK